MNKTGNLRYTQTEGKIKRAFLSLLENNDINAITVNKICTRAEISRPSFYSHFDDINDLIIKIEREKSADIAKILARSDTLTKDDFSDYLTYIEENKSFYKAYFSLKNSSQTLPLMDFYLKNNNLTSSQFLKYNMLFFMAGLKAVVSDWLNGDTGENKDALLAVLLYEYTAFENTLNRM